MGNEFRRADYVLYDGRRFGTRNVIASVPVASQQVFANLAHRSPAYGNLYATLQDFTA